MESAEDVDRRIATLLARLRQLQEIVPRRIDSWQEEGGAAAEARLQFVRVLQLTDELTAACEALTSADAGAPER